MLVDEAFIHAVHITYFAAAYADIACGNVTVGTEVLPEAENEGLAETHDLTVALAAGREVAAAFGATHGEGCEGVFECLLEAEEFQNREVDRSVETDTAFVRADGIVELHAIADVVLHFAFVIKPCDTECHDTVRLDHTLDDFVAFEFRMLIVDILDAHQHFLHCLKVFFFTRMLGFQVVHDTVNIHKCLFYWV